MSAYHMKEHRISGKKNKQGRAIEVSDFEGLKLISQASSPLLQQSQVSQSRNGLNGIGTSSLMNDDRLNAIS